MALQDPYCAWDIKTNSCQAYRPGQKEQLQNVNIGYHPQCPVPIEPTTTVSIFAQLRSFENVLLTAVHTVKSKGKISQNFVAFSEYMNFI